MRTIFFLALLLALGVQPVQAQRKHQSTGVLIHPNISHFFLRNTTNDTIYNFMVEHIQENERPKPSFSLGAYRTYNGKSDKVVKTFGITIRNYGTRVAHEFIAISPEPELFPIHLRFIYDHFQLEGSFGYRRYLGEHFYLVGQPSLGLNLFQTTRIFNTWADGRITSSRSIETPWGLRLLIPAASLGVGAELPLSENTRLNIQPNFRTDLRGLARGTDIQRFYWSAGIRLAVELAAN